MFLVRIRRQVPSERKAHFSSKLQLNPVKKVLLPRQEQNSGGVKRKPKKAKNGTWSRCGGAHWEVPAAQEMVQFYFLLKHEALLVLKMLSFCIMFTDLSSRCTFCFVCEMLKVFLDLGHCWWILKPGQLRTAGPLDTVDGSWDSPRTRVHTWCGVQGMCSSVNLGLTYNFKAKAIELFHHDSRLPPSP